jgi:hypothetical protein
MSEPCRWAAAWVSCFDSAVYFHWKAIRSPSCRSTCNWRRTVTWPSRSLVRLGNCVFRSSFCFRSEKKCRVTNVGCRGKCMSHGAESSERMVRFSPPSTLVTRRCPTGGNGDNRDECFWENSVFSVCSCEKGTRDERATSVEYRGALGMHRRQRREQRSISKKTPLPLFSAVQ